MISETEVCIAMIPPSSSHNSHGRFSTLSAKIFHFVSRIPNLFSTTDVNKRIWRHFSPNTLGTRGANDDLCITEFCTNVHLCRTILSQSSHQKSFNFACGNATGSEQLLPRRLSLTLSVLPWHSTAAVSIINSIAQNLCPPPSNSHRQTDHG